MASEFNIGTVFEQMVLCRFQGSLPKSRHTGSLHDCVRCSDFQCGRRGLRWKPQLKGRDNRRFRPGKGHIRQETDSVMFLCGC